MFRACKYGFMYTDDVELIVRGESMACTNRSFDPVSRPEHYDGDGKVTCRDAMASMAVGYDKVGLCSEVSYWLCCALKYIWRAPVKNGSEDMRKAAQCIQYALDAWEGQHDEQQA